MKEDFKKYLKSNEEVKRIYNDVKKNEEESWRIRDMISLYLQTHSMEEAKKHFEGEKEKKETLQNEAIILYEKQKKASLENNLLYNNFIYKFLENKEKNIHDIIAKYENKAIGEKTKEKIQNEIKEEVKTIDFFRNVEIYPYFNGDFKNYKISLEIREKDKNDRFMYDIKLEFEKKTTYNCYEDITREFYYTSLAEGFSYNYITINNLLYFEDVKKEVKRILKEEKQKKARIETLKENLQKEVKSYNNFINSYNLSSEKEKSYKINTTLYLY